MKRLGTVLVFKEGTTKAEAQKALRKLEEMGLIEITHFEFAGRKQTSPSINEFDDEWGGPVWYIP